MKCPIKLEAPDHCQWCIYGKFADDYEYRCDYPNKQQGED